MQNEQEKIFLQKVGGKIKEMRLKRFLSQTDLSVLMESHPEQVSRVEKGKYKVTITTLKKIADALQIDIRDLFDF